MSYEKLTLERFLERLKGKEYGSLAGARRAVGKTDWSTRAKNIGKEAINKFFGVVEGEAPAAKPKKAAKKAAAAPKAPKAPRAAKAAKAPKVTKARASKADTSEQRAVGAASVITTLTQVELTKGELSEPQKKAYDCALGEYVHNSPHGRALLLQTLARDGIQLPKAVKDALAGDINNPTGVLENSLPPAQANGAASA